MPRGNPSPKLAITVDPDIHQNILATAAPDALQRRAGLAAVAAWENQHGPFTPEEIETARRNVKAQLRAPKARRPA
ncbi:MAG: hypothetical protein JST93_21965 [Acidobacteria bacterium]|nr:hypothetical protein [Acidobacteriota bacterium]